MDSETYDEWMQMIAVFLVSARDIKKKKIEENHRKPQALSDLNCPVGSRVKLLSSNELTNNDYYTHIFILYRQDRLHMDNILVSLLPKCIEVCFT